MQKPDFLTDEQWAEAKPWIVRHFACMLTGLLSLIGAFAYLLLSGNPNGILIAEVWGGASGVWIRVGTWLCNRRLERIRQECIASGQRAA